MVAKEAVIMVRVVSILLLLVSSLVLLCGCGGSKSIEVEPLAAFEGVYQSAYNRSSGTLTIAVASNGQITVTIVDAVEGTFTGTGISNHVGGFYITCNGIGAKQVTVNGTLKGTGLGRTASGTIAGAISVPYNASFTSSADVTIYTNHYEGYYQIGTQNDNWFGDVDASGHFTGSLLVSATSGEIPLSGTVYSNGSFKFTGSNNGTSYTITGNFIASTKAINTDGIVVAKTGSNSVNGVWHGHNAIGG